MYVTQTMRADRAWGMAIRLTNRATLQQEFAFGATIPERFGIEVRNGNDGSCHVVAHVLGRNSVV